MRILFCGQSHYPVNNNAVINRYVSLADAMSDDNEVIFVNRIAIYSDLDITETPKFKYVNCSNRQNNFIKRNLLKVFSVFFEVRTILKLNREKKIDWVNVYTQYFGLCVFYFLMSKVFSFKTVLHYVEIRSSFKNRNWLLKFNDYLFDNYAMFLFDGYLPISTYINQHITVKNKKAKTLSIPPICDFEYFKNLNCLNKPSDNYFLFCGSGAYTEVIVFIIESFNKINDNKNTKLYLVLGGKIGEDIKALIHSNDKIKFFSNLKYTDLICLYKNALALLIPLRNTTQDLARFPQKISEYLASQKAIVTTNYGEIKQYFTDQENALIASDYDTSIFAEKMQWAILNKTKLKTIEEKSYQVGLKYFDIKSYENSLICFLK